MPKRPFTHFPDKKHPQMAQITQIKLLAGFSDLIRKTATVFPLRPTKPSPARKDSTLPVQVSDMDNVKKSRIRLTHWIDHNVDHLKGYEEVAQTLEQEGRPDAAIRVRQGIRMIQEANDEFRAALEHLPADPVPCGKESHDAHHQHGHDQHCGLHDHGSGHKDHH